MSFKKITIVYLPDGIKAVRQFKIPKVIFSIVLVLSFFATAFLVWASNDYLELKQELPDNLKLVQENNQYKSQLSVLAGKIDQMNKKMLEVKEYENKLKSLVNLDTGDRDAQFLGIGGADTSLLDAENSGGKSSQRLVRLMHQSLDDLDTEISVKTQAKTKLFNFLEKQKSMVSCTPSIAPADGWVSSRFGYRISPFTNKKEFHSGLDISSRVGSEISAPSDGVVSSIEKTDGLGLRLTVNHGYGFNTVYGHLSKVLVSKGQAVKREQKIALMGNTGRSTGSHLHYEVHLNGAPVNPERYILN